MQGWCLMLETTVFTDRVSLSPTEWAKATDARRATGDLWTRFVKIHRFCRRRHRSWPTESQLKAHFKRRFPLHSQAKLRQKRARTKPDSRRRKRLHRARHEACQKVEQVTRHVLHHAANAIVAFCVVPGITMLYAGDLGTLNHTKRLLRSRRTNQDVGSLAFGRLEAY